MPVINTNMSSLIAQQSLVRNTRAMTDSMEQLATGKRINSAADDAAGLAVSENMTAQIRGLNMAVRNANDGISMMQTAEGATIEQTNMLQRMRELAVQAASGQISTQQRGYLNDEFNALRTEITRVAQNTSWNNMPLLDGTYSAGAGGISIQVASVNSANSAISVAIASMSAGALGLAPGVISLVSGGVAAADMASAAAAITAIDGAINAISQQRSTLGAVINRLTYAADNLTNISNNTSESRSRILDTDYAKATAELARTQIIQQAGTSVLAQANASPQMVLKLLQG